MGQRFQDEDEVDRQVKVQGRTTTWSLIGIFACFAIVYGLYDWLFDESLKSSKEQLGWLAVFCVGSRFISPLYFEFRFRTKEINNKVSAMHDTLKALTEELHDVSRRLEQSERSK